MTKLHTHFTIIMLLGLLSSLTPLATDMYLPSMLNISKDLNVGIEKVELTLSIFLIFYALGQLLGGIFSDKIGRRTPILIGLIGFSASSLVLFFANSIELLFIFRASQAFFGGIAAVNYAAIIRDLFHGKEAARVFSVVSSMTLLAPLLAPAIGAIVVSYFDWNYIFLLLCIYSCFIIILIFLKLPETGSKTNIKVLESYKMVFTHKKAIKYIFAVSFAFSGMFIFIGKSSFIYMDYFSVSVDKFPFLFGANVLLMIIFTRINIFLVKKYPLEIILKRGLSLQMLSSFLLIFISFNPHIFNIPQVALVCVTMMLYVGSIGFVFGNAMSLALEYFPKNSGVATAVIGVTEFLIAGSIGFIASYIHNGELTPIFILMSLTSISAFLFVL
ncbi:MAG: DHA1 family bicyclomycin/chloramphenicol resistance-like MFS transporter [Sulfurimonas sp.]|jgi:DHA1 family bicyclomycin/chloramphenicol resistance-like MFS transporter